MTEHQETLVSALTRKARILRAAAKLKDGRLKGTKDQMDIAALMDIAAVEIERLAR